MKWRKYKKLLSTTKKVRKMFGEYKLTNDYKFIRRAGKYYRFDITNNILELIFRK